MDNNAYEQNMFACVNRNYENASKNAEKAQLEAYFAAKKEESYNRLRMKCLAIFTIILCATVFLSITVLMFYLNWFGVAPAWVPMVVCTVSGFGAGFVTNAQIRAFRKGGK